MPSVSGFVAAAPAAALPFELCAAGNARMEHVGLHCMTMTGAMEGGKRVSRKRRHKRCQSVEQYAVA